MAHPPKSHLTAVGVMKDHSMVFKSVFKLEVYLYMMETKLSSITALSFAILDISCVINP